MYCTQAFLSYSCLCLFILVNENRNKKQSFNCKVDDRVYVRNSKLVKGAGASQQRSQRQHPQLSFKTQILASMFLNW